MDLIETREAFTMATMFPEVFPDHTTKTNAEYMVYQSLKSLPESYFVFYSKRLVGEASNRREHEIDFIIWNQKDVLICLEVKGGLLAYNGKEDTWHQNGRLMEKSPVRQVQQATYQLNNKLSLEKSGVNFGWALCFPECSIAASQMPVDLLRDQVIDDQTFATIGPTVSALANGIRTARGRRGMSPEEARRLTAELTRDLGFVQILGVRIARDAKQLLQVTQEQYEILADLELNTRVMIEGPAGTGKTVLAQEFGKRLIKQGKSVLLLFYNKAIAKKVRAAFQREDTITVTTFSSYAKRLIEKEDPIWWKSHDDKDDQFWNELLFEKLMDIPTDKHKRFDAIIVDEGQDFKREWFEYLETCLVSAEQSKYTVFLDKHQDIFGNWNSFPCKPTPFRKVLTKNCRNTVNIIEFLKSIYPVDMTAFEHSPCGISVIDRESSSAVHEQSQITKDIIELVTVQKIQPGTIVILLNSEKEASSLNNTKQIGSFPLQSTIPNYDSNTRAVYYSTIKSFKGMEANVVLVVLGSNINESDIPAALYVQGSRAVHALYVYRRG